MMMMPTNFLLLPVGRIVRGWNIIRAYGTVSSLTLSFPRSVSLPFALALLPSRSASPALPETLYLLLYYFFLPMLSFFLGRPRGISGSPTRSRLITLSDRCGLFPRIEADELIFSVINFDPVNHSADTWNIFRTAIDSASRFYLVTCNTYQFSTESGMSYYCTLSVNRSP